VPAHKRACRIAALRAQNTIRKVGGWFSEKMILKQKLKRAAL
jgi:hypothetical protein